MLSRLSVKKPMTVFVCVVLVLILGVMSFINMTTDLLPNMDLPYAIAYTTYIGASPEQVEQSVTKTLESALATTSGVKNITSISQENVSIVVLEFEEGTGMDSAMIEMNASLDQIAGSLPEAAGSPVLMKINPDMLPIMVLAVDSDNMARNELSEFTSSTVIPALERVDGVASVSGSGLVESQIRVELDQAKIDELNDKVLASIDSSLADAEKQLKDSRRQINDAKKKLEEQSGTAYAQLVAAAQQLADAKDQASLGSTLTSAEVKAIRYAQAHLRVLAQLRNDWKIHWQKQEFRQALRGRTGRKGSHHRRADIGHHAERAEEKRQPVLSHSPHPRSGGVVHPAATVPRRSRRRATTGTAETVGASHRTAVFTPVSRCVASQEGESVVGRRRLGDGASRLWRDGKFRIWGAVSAPGRNRSPNAHAG